MPDVYRPKGKPSFVKRKIRNGCVKVLGNWFYPDERHDKYNGMLDGKRYSFGLYWKPDIESYRMEQFIWCWGPAENSGQDFEKWIRDPRIDEEGFIRWGWWRTKAELEKRESDV